MLEYSGFFLFEISDFASYAINHPTRNLPLNGDRFLQLVQKVKTWFFLKCPPCKTELEI
jgi:hypothetical protein